MKTQEKLTHEQVHALKDEDLQVQIALCVLGWHRALVHHGEAVGFPTEEHEKRGQVFAVLDYHADLNAIHELEITHLPTVFERAEYQNWLDRITDVNREPIWFATARQRCEALLLTLLLTLQ